MRGGVDSFGVYFGECVCVCFCFKSFVLAVYRFVLYIVPIY